MPKMASLLKLDRYINPNEDFVPVIFGYVTTGRSVWCVALFDAPFQQMIWCVEMRNAPYLNTPLHLDLLVARCSPALHHKKHPTLQPLMAVPRRGSGDTRADRTSVVN